MNKINFEVFTKPLCRFLIHRYMGQYLKTELTSDQLEFHLADGIATVQGVMLNAEYINETLEASGIKIVSLVDGYVEELTVCVPWNELRHESTTIKVGGLQVTLTPLADINMTNTQELVSSFIGSIASSMDLAKNVIVDEHLANESNNAGIELFASIIDQIISRIKVIFENITIRIESYSEVSGLCTGIEIQIDRMEFLDENLEEQIKNANETITEQPARLYSVTDLNKVLHVQGVRLYTDIWTPLKFNKLISSQINSSDSEAEMETNQPNFQSCYSHFSSRSNSNTATRPQNSIPPSPILFAQLFSGKHTFRIRVNNNNTALTQTDNTYFGKRIDIDIFFDGALYVFLTPSQIVLLKNLFTILVPKVKEQQPVNKSNFGGLPMDREHYNRMTEQMQDELFESEQKQKFVLSRGTWSGAEQFYDFTEQVTFQTDYKPHNMTEEQRNSTQRFRSNSLNTERETRPRNRNTSTSTLIECRPNIFTFSIRAPVLILLITHEDPLSKNSVERYGDSANQTIQKIVDVMIEKANHFFNTAMTLKLGKRKVQEQRTLLSNLFHGDCLRLVANGFFTTYSITSEPQRSVMRIEGHLDECDFIECLFSEKDSKLEQIDIMCLSNVDRGTSSKAVLTFRLQNTPEKENDYFFDIDVENCKTELDPSIVDRINNLLFIQPCFNLCKSADMKNLEIGTKPLDDKLLPGSLNDSESPISFSIRWHCASWLLKLRIPIADLSKIDTPEYSKRKIYEEYLQFEIEGAEIGLPKSLLADILIQWTINFRCKTAKCAFVGDPNTLECSNESMTFLYAETTNAERTLGNINGIKLKISYDKRDKSLSKALFNSENLTKSITDSIFNANDQNNIEGPFSTKDTFHFKDGSNKLNKFDDAPSQKLIKAGSREDLMEFAKECRILSNFFVDISIAQLNLGLPSRKFFEILYNRLANDLALWEPKTMVNHHQMEHNLTKEFVECHSAFAPLQENEDDFERNSDGLTQCILPRRSLRENSTRNHKVQSHQFSFGIHVDKARILIQRSNDVNYDDKIVNNLISQLGIELITADIFFVYGFKGDPNLSYFYTTSTNAQLFHKNLLDEIGFCSDVGDSQTFMLPRQKENIYLNEIPKDYNFERINDDNFVISLKTYLHKNTNTKDILLAIGLRNSLINFRPFEKMQHFWVLQFADFFNITDFGVPGYVAPKVDIDLRIHFSNVFLGYDHSSIIPNSPFQLRLEIGSSYITTHLVENIERLKIDCIFEDINMWMRKKISQSVKFDSQMRFYNPTSNFTKIMMSDSIHFLLAYTLFNFQTIEPLIDFASADENITLWLCSDTIVEFFNILKEFFSSDIITNCLGSIKPPKPNLQQEENNVPTENLTNDKTEIRRNVSINDEERLIKDMEAAMNDMPAVYHTNRKKQLEMMTDEKLSSKSITENTDDEFIVIDKVPTREGHKPAIGITQIGNRTDFDTGTDFEFITTQLNLSSTMEESFDEQQSDLSSLLLSYKVTFKAITIYVFGGSDFAARTLPQKTYSQWDTNRDTKLMEEIGSQGGRYRDHTVLIEIKFTRLSAICKLFNESSPNLSRILLEIGDFNIIDHLSISQINEMVHRLEIEGQPRSSVPFLKIFLNEDQLREAILRISLAPIRLNFDQDTFDFLMDFKNELVQGLKCVFDVPTVAQKDNDDNDVPVMEVPKVCDDNVAFDVSSENNRHSSKGVSISFNDLRERDGQHTANIEELFSEEDVVLTDSMYEEKCSSSKNSSRELAEENEIQDKARAEEANNNYPKALAAKTTFIKDFTFSPACRLRIDYEAKKRIRTDQQGPFLAFMLGMTNLKKTELVLKEIRVEKGFLGFGKCAQFTIDEWQNDIINKQLQNVVGGVAVINAIVQLAQGCKDLVVFPLEEYQRENGQLARGIQKGTSSFIFNLTTATIDAIQRFVGLVQNGAELTYDISNPNFAYQQGVRPIQIPLDIREGFSLACNTVREGFIETAQTLQTAAEQDRVRGGWGIGILRHITPTAIKPIVVASRATSHVLGGLKNQLKPEEHREEMRKWRHNSMARRGFEQLRRQSSSSSIQQSSSSSTGSHQVPPRKNI